MVPLFCPGSIEKQTSERLRVQRPNTSVAAITPATFPGFLANAHDERNTISRVPMMKVHRRVSIDRDFHLERATKIGMIHGRKRVLEVHT